MSMAANSFPLDVFPAKMQKLILNLTRTRSFKLEYIASAMLVAAATAIGNSRQVCLRMGWNLSPMFYMVLVGRPGLGKTPPLNFAFRPLDNLDCDRASEYKKKMRDYARAMEAYQKSKSKGNPPEEPIPVQTMVSDCTEEALLYIHACNPRGICILYDEIVGFFKTLNRYNSSSMIENLLSIFSGAKICCSRKGNALATVVQRPCVSLVGTIQTALLSSLAKYGTIENGLLDRFLFVCPENSFIPEWSDDDDSDDSYDTCAEWESILHKLIELQPESSSTPVVIYADSEASTYFKEWHNKNIKVQNAILDDADLNHRIAKWDYIVPRMALVLHLLHWACEEENGEPISLATTQKAIRLNEFYEGCYQALQDVLESEVKPDKYELLYACLPMEFKTQEAVKIGARFEIKIKSVKNFLKDMVGKGRLLHQKWGVYLKNMPP